MIVVYDGDCEFCRRCALWAKAHARGLEIVPWQSADLPSLGLTPEECQAAVQAVDGNQRWSGGAAVAQVLRRSRQPWPPIGAVMSAPGMRGITEFGYRWVATRRGRWPFRGA